MRQDLVRILAVTPAVLTQWRRVLLEKLTGFQLVKKFPAFYGTQWFITTFTRVCHLSVSWDRSIQSVPPIPLQRRSILILSSHLHLGLLSGLFPSSFPTKTPYTHLLSLIRATCPAHLILLDFITRTIFGEEYRSLIYSLCIFLQSPISAPLLCTNIFLSKCHLYQIYLNIVYTNSHTQACN